MIGKETVMDALARVLANPEVGGNARPTRLLRHLVTETLAGREDRLKGTSLAIDVFERNVDFDPSADAVVRSEARRLRQALASHYFGAGARDPVVIAIPKGGYVPRFDRRADVVPSAGAETADASSPMTPPPSADPAPVRSLAMAMPGKLVVALLLGLGIVVSAGAMWQNRGADRLTGQPSVLVTPFEAATVDMDLQVLSSGITAQVIADLIRFPTFRLYSFEDSLQVAREGPEAELGVDFLVRGVLRGDEDTLSLIVRLIDAADGSVVWSEAFVRPLEPGAIAALQAEISGEIAAKIGEPYGIVRDRVTRTVIPDNADLSGFACVMRAQTYRHANRPDLYAPARACLEDLVVSDPTYAEAWALLAFMRLDGGRFAYEARTPQERIEAYDAARAAAVQALEFDTENELAISALAMIEHYAGRFEESLRYSEMAVQANPNDPSTLAYHGWRLGAQGQLDDGVPYVQEAIARSVNPQPTFFHVIAIDRLMAGDMQGMLAAAQRAAVDRSSPSDAFLAIAYGGLGNEQEAEAALESMARKWPLMGRDPAAAFGWHNLHPDIVAAIVAGLENAGWSPPVE
jgi:TolB-like protein